MFVENILAKAEQMGIHMTADQAQQFLRYHELLVEGNKRMNLTRIGMDDPVEGIDRNYLDSIAPLSFADSPLHGARTAVDVGAGAGFPGIPLSIMLPDCEITMMDALKKRVGFLNEVIEALGLNARAVHSRAEDAGHDINHRERYDIALARAVAALPVLLEYCLPMVRAGGALIAYKGPTLAAELAQSQSAIKLLGGDGARVLDVSMPMHDDWAHKLCIIEKVQSTPAKYPRKPAEIDKKPL